ncbi:HGH1 protein, partial [Aphelocoma coerulescens]|nr:HGH1 protein [Aphelocoma coerulescens]
PQLSATAPGRLQLRSRGAFLVLRELHGWEQHPGVLRACRQLIQVLIGDEPEAGMENLLEVKVPEELERSLRAADEEEEEEEQRWRKEQQQ